ncbi:MAG: glycosyltransferase family 2 protein [Pseudomonadota bacterium]
MAYSLRELKRDLATRDTPVQRWIDGTLWQWRNRRKRAAATPDATDLRVVFAIPLISKAGASDWATVQDNLRATLITLCNQTDSRWQAVICGQDRPDVVDMDARITFLPFPDRPEGFDKRPKTLMLRRHIAEDLGGAGYYFALDADDLLHPGLVAHILTDNNQAGYQIDRGYMLDHATLALATLQPPDAAYPAASHFYRSCGSSSAIYFDFGSGADYAAVLAARGNHRKVVRNMAYLGLAMAFIPFPAGIYVMNHGDNLRQKRGKMSGKMKHFNENPVRDPVEIARIAQDFAFAELFPRRWPPDNAKSSGATPAPESAGHPR